MLRMGMALVETRRGATQSRSVASFGDPAVGTGIGIGAINTPDVWVVEAEPRVDQLAGACVGSDEDHALFGIRWEEVFNAVHVGQIAHAWERALAQDSEVEALHIG